MADLSEKYPNVPLKRILFLGDEKTGKTTFIRNYCGLSNNDHYRCGFLEGNETVFTEYLLYLERLKNPALIRFFAVQPGTIGGDRRSQYPDDVNLIVLCYAVDNSTSFENVTSKWLKECRLHYRKDPRIFLLGLKNDRGNLLEEARQVHNEYGIFGHCLECSVEGNPDEARRVMEKLIDDTFLDHPPKVFVYSNLDNFKLFKD